MNAAKTVLASAVYGEAEGAWPSRPKPVPNVPRRPKAIAYAAVTTAIFWPAVTFIVSSVSAGTFSAAVVAVGLAPTT